MSTSHRQPSKRLISLINHPHNSLKSNLVLLVFIAAVTLLFSSWGNARYSMGGYNAGQLAITDHVLHTGKNVLNYKATTGYMPLVDKQSKPLANIFYVAYTAGNATDNTRPVTFVFNGGPGSAAIWLHMGSFGPVRVLFKNDKGDAPEKSEAYADNPYSWLGFTDLVFIDPVATGYSRAQEDVNVKQFYSYKNDVASIGEFIRLYLEKNNRQNSPKFLAGESYGAVRAIGLAEYLQDNYKVTLNGITLISPALNYQLIKFNDTNQQPYSYYLPSYAAAAQYHHRLAPALQQLPVQQLVAKVTAFARGSYSLFLSEGNSAPESLTNKVIDSLHYFTGLSEETLRRAHGRITDNQFCRALLRSDSLTIGTFDSRFTGAAANADPSENNLRGLFTHAFNNYIVNGLQYQNNLPYKATVAIGDWDYGTRKTNSYLDISETLKKVMVQNPLLKINIAAGYYDLATPVNTTAYVIDHLGLSPQLRGNISIDHYESGHMIYISKTANHQFRQNAEKFYQTAL
ncbi:peptidase S10 [Mucilaginibacter corticis]|uniref:Peptidase S10 n=1 Tax=Mucilaginibacter corticis TaxID=2597670 RepID=A0A556MU80_9SPHI|nr:peptidase S10 [Mucilaginibacter corticis]TSJ43504.1 peptidase S10 [Mucilaginibacter corticis]